MITLLRILTDEVIHIDFNRISLDKEIEIKVKVLTKGEAIGVKRDGGSTGLDELHPFIGRHVEGLPVDGEVLRGLVNGGGGSRLGDGPAAADHFATRGGGVGQGQRAEHGVAAGLDGDV